MNLEIDKRNELLITDYVNKFLNYIDVKDKTVETYKIALKQFCSYLQENNIKTPTREDIIEYREILKQNVKPNTVNSYLIAIRNLYDYLEYEGITKNITKNIKGMSVGNEHKRNALNEEQCKKILDNALNDREKIIFLLGVVCGLRANEIVNIQINDFKEKDGKICLYVLGKARDYKEDFVVVPNDLFELIKKYVEENRITNYLLVSNSNHNHNGKLTTKTIRLIVKNMFKRVGIVGEEYVFHSCRHSFATFSLKNGIDIREVSQAMRHKSISTTLVYSHDLEKINNKCSNSISNILLS